MTGEHTKHTYRTVAAVLALALLAVGCGGGDEKSDGSTTSASSSTTEEDGPSTTARPGKEPTEVTSSVMSKAGATAALEDESGAVLSQALGFPESIASFEGEILRVSAQYSAPGTTDRIPSETWTIDMIQDQPPAEVSAALRAHFTEAGFTFTPSSTENDMTGTTKGPDGTRTDLLLGITLEDAGNGTTKAELLLNHMGTRGEPAEVEGDVFAFIENLEFDEAMALSNADVSINSGKDTFLGEMDPYVSFSASFQVPADGYDDAEAALAQVCTGKVDDYACGEEGIETFGDDEGVQVDDFESPDHVTFDVVLFKPGPGSDVPVYQFTATGDGFQ
jgi:hypothetical protein